MNILEYYFKITDKSLSFKEYNKHIINHYNEKSTDKTTYVNLSKDCIEDASKAILRLYGIKNKKSKVSSTIKKRIDLVLLLLEELNTSVKDDYFMQISKYKFESLFNKYQYKKLKDALIDKKIIICDNKYISPEYAKLIKGEVKNMSYKLTDKYLTKHTIKHTLYKPRVYNNTNHLDNLVKIKSNRIARIELDEYRSIILPSRDKVLKYADFLVKSKSGYKGRDYKWFGNNSKYTSEDYIDLNYGLKQYDRLVKDGFRVPTEKNGRVCTSFNLLSKWVRTLLEIEHKGNIENLVELDYSALHPNIFRLFYLNNMDKPGVVDELEMFDKYISGDSHTKIMDITNNKIKNKNNKIKRKDIKIAFLSFFNDKTFNVEIHDKAKIKYKDVLNIFKTKTPILYHHIVKAKSSNNNETGDVIVNAYKRMSKWLTINESVLIENLMVECKLNHIPVFNCYDAIFIPESEYDNIIKKLNDITKINNILTELEKEKD